jgi:hypothetical protein
MATPIPSFLLWRPHGVTAGSWERREVAESTEAQVDNNDTTPPSRLSLTRLASVLEESGGYEMVIGPTGESVDGVAVYRLQLELPLVADERESAQ